MSIQESKKAIVRRFAEEILSEKKLDRADEIMAQDYIDHGAMPGKHLVCRGSSRKGRSGSQPSPIYASGRKTCSRKETGSPSVGPLTARRMATCRASRRARGPSDSRA